MANEQIMLRAKARKLGVDGYRKMSLEALKKAIKNAEGTSSKTAGKTAARKTSSNGRKTATGTKTTGTKSAGRAKSAPAKSARSGAKAKRQTTGAKSTTRKPAASKRQTSNNNVLRADIDNSSVDWTAEWGGGKTGNRGEIMKLLRKAKGNVEKVYDKLADKAKSMYPKTQDGRARSKADAQTLLRWHISRIKYDFVKATDQHESADNPNYRKAAKGNTRGGKTTTTRGRKSTGSGKSAAKPARKPAGSQKRSQGRAKAPAKTTARRTGGRKTAASRKRR